MHRAPQSLGVRSGLSVLGSDLPEPGYRWWRLGLSSPITHQAPQPLPSSTPMAQNLTGGRGRTMLPAEPAFLLALSRLRRRGGHPVPQSGNTGMPHGSLTLAAVG